MSMWDLVRPYSFTDNVFPLFSAKELLKCSKKTAVSNQADIKSLETVVALVEVG